MDNTQVRIAQQDLKVVARLEGMPGIDVGDQEFVLAAASTPGAILVTDDGPLLQRLKEEGIAEPYGFLVVTAREAMSLARTDGA